MVLAGLILPHYGNYSDYDVRNNIVSKATRSQNYSVVDPAGNSLLLSSSLSHNNLRRARKVVEVGELNFLPFGISLPSYHLFMHLMMTVRSFVTLRFLVAPVQSV